MAGQDEELAYHAIQVGGLGGWPGLVAGVAAGSRHCCMSQCLRQQHCAHKWRVCRAEWRQPMAPAPQALDVVLKHRVSYNKDCLPVGRGFFFHDQNVGWDRACRRAERRAQSRQGSGA